MSEMIKQVAKALYLSEGPSREGPVDKFERLARAAIEAMREPTDEMRAAYWNAIENWTQSSVVWQAMIDAALKDKSETTAPSHEPELPLTQPK